MAKAMKEGLEGLVLKDLKVTYLSGIHFVLISAYLKHINIASNYQTLILFKYRELTSLGNGTG
jgi:hypothetical protein